MLRVVTSTRHRPLVCSWMARVNPQPSTLNPKSHFLTCHRISLPVFGSMLGGTQRTKGSVCGSTPLRPGLDLPKKRARVREKSSRKFPSACAAEDVE
jgi:hypothetical protein